MKTTKNNGEIYQGIAILMPKSASWIRQRDFYKSAYGVNYHTLQDTFLALKKQDKFITQYSTDNLRQAYFGKLKKYTITKLSNYIEKVADEFEGKSK